MNRLRLAVALSLCFAMPLFAMSKADAKKLIADYGLKESAEGMLGILNTSMPDAPKLVEAFLTLGVRADKPVTYETDDHRTLTMYPLNYLLMFACADDTTPAMAKLLVDAGADPNTIEPESDWAALTQAHACPDVLRVLLAAPKKPDVNRVDRNGKTTMHYIVVYRDDRQLESIPMLLAAGFDIARWRKELLDEARGEPEVITALGGKPAPAPPRTPSKPATAAKIDWKALPPYPQRSAAEARKMLERPGAATTIDDHMWDGITSREPLRLALALQAGADIHQKRNVTGYTPLVLLAERCDLKDEELQTANAKLLIEGGADLTGVDANGANALIMAAGDCPIGVVRALLAAGIAASARTADGTTALKNAIMDGRADVVEALLGAGVDPKKEPYNVRALASGNSAIEALLRKKKK